MAANQPTKHVVVMGAFDDLRSPQIRFLQEAAKMGEVTALLWNDELVECLEGKPPKFSEAEREYFLRAIRFVQHVILTSDPRRGTRGEERGAEVEVRNPRLEARSPRPERADKSELEIGSLLTAAQKGDIEPDVLVVSEAQDTASARALCRERGIGYRVLQDEDARGFPEPAVALPAVTSERKRVIVTGCFDWVHSGHVRFFEEVSAYGDLYVILGHDANLRLLKGPGHPHWPQAERRYVVSAIRYVTQALISSGEGWLDAEPEIERIRPDIYAVNEDGDRGGKREYCAQHGIEYLVLKRASAPGLPPRTSTELRGF
jgi:cytidyltransferase-like protein